MNLGQLRANVRSNLVDSGIAYYSDISINTSIQDAYNEVAAKCRCITKSNATIAQQSQTPYYDFLALGITDYLGTIAIYNQDTNYWLRDDISLRDFDRIRKDWENWYGEPQFWAPHSQRIVAVAPNQQSVNGSLFTLWYWATAPTLTSDASVPLVATDMQPMLEFYATGDLLQTAEEVTKASIWLADYEKMKLLYKDRCINLARADLLLRV